MSDAAPAIPAPPIDLEARREHVRLLDDRGTILVPDPKEGEPKVIVVTNGGLEAARRLSDRGLERPFGRASGRSHDVFATYLERAAAELGIEHVVPHDLRRTFAVRARRAGFDIADIGQTMGHKSIQTTLRYARILDQTRVDVSAGVTAGLD